MASFVMNSNPLVEFKLDQQVQILGLEQATMTHHRINSSHCPTIEIMAILLCVFTRPWLTSI